MGHFYFPHTRRLHWMPSAASIQFSPHCFRFPANPLLFARFILPKNGAHMHRHSIETSQVPARYGAVTLSHHTHKRYLINWNTERESIASVENVHCDGIIVPRSWTLEVSTMRMAISLRTFAQIVSLFCEETFNKFIEIHWNILHALWMQHCSRPLCGRSKRIACD